MPACRFKEPFDKTFDRWEVTGEYSDLTGADKGDTFFVKGDCVVKAIWRDANPHIGREEVTPTPTETPDPTETLEPSVTPEATQTPAPSVTATAAPGYGSGGTYGTGTSGGGYSAGTGTSAANEYDVSQKSAVSTDDNTDTTVYLFMMALSMLSLLLITGRRRNR